MTVNKRLKKALNQLKKAKETQDALVEFSLKPRKHELVADAIDDSIDAVEQAIARDNRKF